MPDSKSFPAGSPKDSDDRSDKTAGRNPEQPASEDDSVIASDDRAIETTVVHGSDTKRQSSDQTVSLDGSGKTGKDIRPEKTMVLGDNASTSQQHGENPTLNLDKPQEAPMPIDPSRPEDRADDPMQTMVIGKNQNIRDLFPGEPEAEEEAQEPEQKKTLSLNPTPPESREADPMQTMVIGDDQDLSDLIADKPRAEKEGLKSPERAKTVALDRVPPPSDDPNQTMILGENKDLRDLVSSKSQPDEPGHQKTISLGPSTTGQSRSKADATATSVPGQDGKPQEKASASDDVSHTTPLKAGNSPEPSSSSHRVPSGTMVLGDNSNPPQPSNDPRDARNETVVLGNQGQTPRPGRGEAGNQTMPLDGSSASPSRGVQTVVLGTTAAHHENVAGGAPTKSSVPGQGQATETNKPGTRTVPLGEMRGPAAQNPVASAPVATEPLTTNPSEISDPIPGGTFPEHARQDPNAPLEQRSTQSIPLRATSLGGDAPRAGETRQAQLMRRTTSALAFTALAIVISLLCAILSSSTVSITYFCSILALLVGMFSFCRYTRLLRHLETATSC